MRCLTCGEEMRVVHVVPDESMSVPGYEYQTLECSGCRELEQRRVFRSEPPSVSPERAGSENAAVELSPFGSEGAVLDAPLDLPAHPEAQASIAPTPSAEVDDAEEMLRRAIEMVRGGRDAPLRGLTDRGPATPSKLAGTTQERKTGRVVQIRHDPTYGAAYAAKDTRSGLVVLRHQDSSRLRAMCDRLGWQVVEDGAPGLDV